MQNLPPVSDQGQYFFHRLPRSLAPDVDSISCVDAVITPFMMRRIGSNKRAIKGAVYVDGVLLAQSQRMSGIAGDIIVNDDPAELSLGSSETERLEHFTGKWLYGGHFMSQFGHFITETLTNLWMEGDFDGILFEPFIFGNNVSAWQKRLIERLHPEIPIHILPSGARVENLVVSSRPVALNRSVTNQAIRVWDRLALPGSRENDYFLSRSALENNSRELDGDSRLDELMSDLGFEVVHPEKLDIDTQLEIAGKARILAGSSGSALHISVFSHPDTVTLEIGDSRTSTRGVRMQEVIDGAIGRRSAFVPPIWKNQERDLVATKAHVVRLIDSL